MKIILNKIEIKNFKGVKDLSIDFNPAITQIMGANHTGKTTTADAIHWVLFGKNSEGLTVFGIDPKDEKNNIIHHLDNIVKLELTADGRDIVLEKVRKETWKKVKGHDEETLTGHTTDCFIDGNKYTAQDYQAEISALISESLFKAITNPAYFPSLKADEQRTLLIKMVGERSVEEIAGGNEEFLDVVRRLEGKDIKELRSHISYKMKELKDAIQLIPSRISENQDWINGVQAQGFDFETIRKEIADIEKQIAECDRQLKDRSAVVDAEFERRAEQRKVINRIKAELQDMVDKVEAINRKSRREWLDERSRLDGEIQNLRIKKKLAEEEKKAYSDRLVTIAERTHDFRLSWEAVEAETFKWDDTQEVCPTCGQHLPSEQVEELRSKAEDVFNQKHQHAQDQLDKQAESIKQDKAKAEALIETTKTKITELEKQINETETQLKEVQETGYSQVVSAESTPEFIALKNKIEDEENKLEKMTAEQSGDKEAGTEEIERNKAELTTRRDALRDKLVIESEIKSRTERIKELEKQQKQLVQQLTELEKQDYQAEALEHATIEDLQNRVNALFENVRFEMFQTQLNGNVKPTCTLTMHGVPYNDLSNSEKINAGIDIINVMCRFNDAYAPIVIDNAESVNDILPSTSQQICLNVSRDPQLTVIK